MAVPAHAEQYLVKNQAEYNDAAKKLVAGDVVTLANGEWQDFEIKISGKGTKAKPIILTSQDPGKVLLTGQSNLRIGGEYILVSGLVFKNGYSPTGEVISFRRSKDDLARNSRVTEVVIDHFSKPDRYDDDYWVAMYGKNNRFDHNHLVGKTNKGVTFAVRLDSKESQENGHRIDHNYFGPRPVLGSNGGETLRIGTSHYSMFNSNTLVENNYFDRCDGEVEIISSKSGNNIYRGNVFDQSRGALVFRHGDGTLVENNVFLGRGKAHTGGIRVINRNQTVRNNYMEGLDGTGFVSALTVMNGVPNSPVNRYVQVDGAVIENNTIIDSKRITLGAGADEERSAAPVNSRLSNNILGGSSEGNLVDIDADISGIKFTNNILVKGKAAQPIAGIKRQAVAMTRGENGLVYPEDPALAKMGASRDLKPVTLDQVGVSWYPKPKNDDPFGGGKTVEVSPGEDSLTEAFVAAKNGDTLSLASGHYIVNRVMALDKAITLQGPAKQTGASIVSISFARPNLFEIKEGGNLKLSNLKIIGDLAPDSVGNSVIRTTSYPIQSNFEIRLEDVTVTNLSVNKSFNVISLGKSSMADRVTIKDSIFDKISGSIIQAAAETEDYGQYNADYVDISDTTFRNIDSAIANIYRGGRDESTFGPHFTMRDSTVENVGKSANNSSGASIVLHGVQYNDITDNRFIDSAPLKIIQTVGTPETKVADNKFENTPAPVVEELNYQGASRVDLSDNIFSNAVSK
ncbi:polysaccharide lyase 6 family protein [Parasphingorhabdus halotolerans]|uniref:polysaccharide lyase 6 family protein n=1 Tax=Parasphingorhabdus halotolerans TaxID=2725558 RepID=UPI001B3A0757|nr:polysaccharide lyase 6 family protein [Parasphingorhabdus halotolerans]